MVLFRRRLGTVVNDNGHLADLGADKVVGAITTSVAIGRNIAGRVEASTGSMSGIINE